MRLDATSLIQCDDRSVARIRESVDIDAPSERVWAVVAEDVTNAPKWTSNLDKVEKLDDGPPGRGTRYRYHLDLGGHKEKLEVEQTVYAKPKKCSGKFIQGPLKGTWSYTYTQHKDGSTRLAPCRGGNAPAPCPPGASPCAPPGETVRVAGTVSGARVGG